MWFIGVEVEQATSAPPPKKNPGSAPARGLTAVWPKYSVPAINIVSSVLGLADCAMETRLSTQENWI